MNRRNKFHMYRSPKDMRPQDSQAIEAYMPSWAKEKGGRGQDFKVEETSPRKEEEQVSDNAMRISFWYKSSLIFTLFLVREGIQLFLSLSGLDYLQLKIIPFPKWHILGVAYSALPWSCPEASPRSFTIQKLSWKIVPSRWISLLVLKTG